MKMFMYWLTLIISLLFVHINADVNKAQHVAIAVSEHQSNDIIENDLLDQSSQTTTEKILSRVTRMDADLEKSRINARQRRDIIDTDEILGMARKVAITVFVLLSLCIVCISVTIIFICYKCCCSGNDNRKRTQGFNTIPQPIIIHTNSPNYQSQYHHQQASSPQPQPQLPAQIWQPENRPMLPQPEPPAKIWQPESHPMLPQPSAPPRPNDDSYMERPPAYEKLYAT